MADSEISTSLSTVTRRSLTAGSMTAALMPLAHKSLAAETTPPTDPALSLWREWQAAHARSITLCREQQRLETELADTIGFPHAVAAHQARWDTADQRLGYSTTKQAEADAEEQAWQLAETLWATPAASLTGVAAKLDAILALQEYGEACDEFPCPQIRSALADLVRIGGLGDQFEERYGDG